jgi:acyl phosphate:glycerol-3-phosphate acyltransferase
MFIPLLLAAVVGYLLGSLPFGWLIARKFGVNIFEHGSKNPGATNVKRVLGEMFGKRGKRAGNWAFALDALKGAVAAGWPLWYARCMMRPVYPLGEGNEVVWIYPDGGWMARLDTCVPQAIVGLVFALLGHSFSCWTRFKGGKGVATSVGGLLVLLPLSGVIGLAVWALVFQVSRYVSLASIVASVALPASAWLIPGTPRPFALLATMLGVFVIIRHRPNIVRLLNGTENKFAKKASAPVSSPGSSARS